MGPGGRGEEILELRTIYGERKGGRERLRLEGIEVEEDEEEKLEGYTLICNT